MEQYTVVVEASNADGTIWQALAPAETAEGDTTESVAQWTATNQTVADGDNWRVLVWDGADADTNAKPAYEYYPA